MEWKKSEGDAMFLHVQRLSWKNQIVMGVPSLREIVAPNGRFWRNPPVSTTDIGTKNWESVSFDYQT